jgi:hypothetical protein
MSSGPEVQRTSATLHPAPFASTRAATPPRAPDTLRFVNASSNSAAIFAKKQSLARAYKGFNTSDSLLDVLRGQMMNTILAQSSALSDALAYPGRAPEIEEGDDIYGWLVGSWELDIRTYWVAVSERKLKGEAHFGWVLEGRAVQDVWMLPRPADRPRLPDQRLYSYGTTLRVWDPNLRAWRVTWMNPVTSQRTELIGRRVGDDIVQVGSAADGTPVRWIFSKTTPDSFRWTGETLQPDGRTWKLQGDFFARRVR